MAPNTIIRGDNTTDQKTLMLVGGLSCNAHIAVFRARLQNTLYVGSVTFNTEQSLSHMRKYDKQLRVEEGSETQQCVPDKMDTT